MKRSTRNALVAFGLLFMLIWFSFNVPGCALEVDTTWQRKQPTAVIVGTKPDPKRDAGDEGDAGDN